MTDHLFSVVAGLAGVTFCTAAAALPAPVGSETARTVLHNSQTSVTPLTPSDKARAEAWGLSETEWRRYQQLMQGVRGSISPAMISPVEVLGIHARSPDERHRFAEQWFRIMRDDAERILAFQHAYDEAARRLLGDQLLIEPSRLPSERDSDGSLDSTDRILFFTKPDCAPCDLLWERLAKQVGQVAGIDIYLTNVGAGDDHAIREWAAAHGIEPDWVHQRQVTLNHAGELLDRLTHGRGESPMMMRFRDGQATRLPTSALD